MLRSGQVTQLTGSSVLWTCHCMKSPITFHNFEVSKHTRDHVRCVLLFSQMVDKQARKIQGADFFFWSLRSTAKKIHQNDTCKVKETDIHHQKALSSYCEIFSLRRKHVAAARFPCCFAVLMATTTRLWMRGCSAHAEGLYALASGRHPTHCTRWQEAGTGQPNAEI